MDKGKKWSEISKNMSTSRTENTVKNRFNSLMKKERLAFAEGSKSKA
jgi:hypothetical protein